MTPTDENAFVGLPPLGCPDYDEVHISVCFTWDLHKIKSLERNWSPYGKIKIGGPAVNGSRGDFVPGMYLREGITITSRGCPNNCHYCLVPKREGKLRELPIKPGRIVQDDNLLACSPKHIKAVLEMLKTQKQIEFSGGLETKKITIKIAEDFNKLSIRHLWLSYDNHDDENAVEQAVKYFKVFFRRDQIRCYVLIGYEGDNIQDAEKRLRLAWQFGTLPFAMRYRKPVANFKDSYVFRDRSWNILTRMWSRPASTKAIMAKK